jgi:hypothetical protein
LGQQRNKEVELSRVVYPSNIESHLRAYIDDTGLVISGQDLGPGVEAIWGDLDYEYWLVVAPQHLDRVVERLAKELEDPVEVPASPKERDLLLLDLLKRAWERGRFETDVDFRQWLDTIDVPSEFASYV